MDRIEPLGDVQKRAGRNELPVLVAHPQQQLVADDMPRAEIDDRLREQLKALVGSADWMRCAHVIR